jgi:hypothetical protein
MSGPLTSRETASGVPMSTGPTLSTQRRARHISAGTSDIVGMCQVEDRISGSFITWQRISFTVAGPNADIEVVEIRRLSQFGHAPPIATPGGPPTEAVS